MCPVTLLGVNIGGAGSYIYENPTGTSHPAAPKTDGVVASSVPVAAVPASKAPAAKGGSPSFPYHDRSH